MELLRTDAELSQLLSVKVPERFSDARGSPKPFQTKGTFTDRCGTLTASVRKSSGTVFGCTGQPKTVPDKWNFYGQMRNSNRRI